MIIELKYYIALRNSHAIWISYIIIIPTYQFVRLFAQTSQLLKIEIFKKKKETQKGLSTFKSL